MLVGDRVLEHLVADGLALLQRLGVRIIIVQGVGPAAVTVDDNAAVLALDRLADILIVEGNPLDDMQALTDVQMVIHNGVVIREGIVLTIGYLVTEAQTVWISNGDMTIAGHVLGYDQATGFGLVQALGKLNLPPLPLGDSDAVKIGDPVVVAGGGGLDSAVAAHVVAKQEFAGYWEYLLDEAIFTAPAHPHWGGAAVINSVEIEVGDLAGVEIDALEFCFEVARRGTPAASEARLVIRRVDGRGECVACGANVAVDDFVDLCPECGVGLVEITHGREMRVVSINVD